MEDILIPIAFFAACVTIVYLLIQAKMKRAKMEHEERMLAMEKGIPVPPRNKESVHNPYKWPIILIALGIAWLGASIVQGDQDFLWALLPLIVGVGLLLAHQKTAKETQGMIVPPPPPPPPPPMDFNRTRREASETKTSAE